MSEQRHFISYSNADAAEFAQKLSLELQGGPPPLPVWIDKEQIKPSLDWDEQIVDGLRECRTLLLVMTPESVKPNSVCKQEWTRALKYKKSIVPLLLDGEAEMPFRLGSRQYVDFTRGFDIGLAELREHLIWLDSPQGELKTLSDCLADARRARQRVTDMHGTTIIQEKILELIKQIEKQEALDAKGLALCGLAIIDSETFQVSENLEGLEALMKRSNDNLLLWE